MFRKLFFIAIVATFIGTFSANSFAQGCISLLGVQSNCKPGTTGTGTGTDKATGTTDLVFVSNGQLYGKAYAYDASHFELYPSGGGVLKTYSNSCKEAAPSNGVRGVVCTFGHFDNNNQLQYSGWTYIYENGVVYLRWMYQARSGFRYVDGDTGWVAFRPKS